MRIKRDFEVYGIKFNLSDNRTGISKCNYEFFPKWKLLRYDEYYKAWLQVACVDTKKEALEYIKWAFETCQLW